MEYNIAHTFVVYMCECGCLCVSVLLVCSLHVFPLRLPHFNEFLLYVNLFSFEFFRQMASRRAQKCNYAFIKEINCKQCQTKKERTAFTCVVRMRLIENSTNLEQEQTVAKTCNQSSSRESTSWLCFSLCNGLCIRLCAVLCPGGSLSVCCVVSRTLLRLLS